jgi:hypothetical protein
MSHANFHFGGVKVQFARPSQKDPKKPRAIGCDPRDCGP